MFCEGGSYGADSPVEDADEDFHRGAGDGEGVFELEEGWGESEVGEEAGGEGQGREGEADDGEVLEVPAVGVVAVVGGDFVSGVWGVEEGVEGVGEVHLVGVEDEVGERVGEGGEAEGLWVGI